MIENPLYVSTIDILPGLNTIPGGLHSITNLSNIPIYIGIDDNVQYNGWLLNSYAIFEGEIRMPLFFIYSIGYGRVQYMTDVVIPNILKPLFFNRIPSFEGK